MLVTEERCAFSDARKLCGVVTFSDLPQELEELVLNKLSVPELARLSRTCRSFHAVFRRHLAKQQKACYDLAVARFGNEMIVCIADLMDSWLEGKDDPCLMEQCLRVCQTYAEALQQVEGGISAPCRLSVEPSGTGMPPSMASRDPLYIVLPAQNKGWVSMDFFFWQPIEVTIDVFLSRDLEGLVLVQALFSRALASTVCNAWRHISITVDVVGADARTPHGWRGIVASCPAQIRPLLALLSPHPNWSWR